MNEFELGYLTGIIDGEGCLGIYESPKGKYYATIQIVIRQKFILESIKAQFEGGSIRKRIRRNPNWNPLWHYTLSKKALLRKYLPKLPLKIKEKQKEVMLCFLDCNNEEDKKFLRGLMKKINRRGTANDYKEPITKLHMIVQKQLEIR